jgi:PAS domain S-box-containing protein
MDSMKKINKPKRIENSSRVTDIILESISDGVFTVDHNWRIMSFNRAAEEITGISRNDAIGRYCWEVFRSNMCEGDCALRNTMEQSKPFVNSSTYIVTADKRRIPIAVSTSLLCDENGEVLGGVEVFRDLSMVEELRRELDSRFELGDMVSRSPAMQKIFDILPQIAESDSTILVHGETGTGKELLARAVHNLSSRRNKKFFAINCGALPDTLLESELFGYKAGAFTNAVKDKQGILGAAEGGTILLDEIGDISPAFQVRLLRVLEEREYQPLGDTKTVKADIRVIASTNRDLTELVKTGGFRNDLYYRVNVVRVELPPLRERMEDIPLLSEKFIKRLNNLRGRSVTGLHPEALGILMSHDYPGNIRELENIIEHAFVLCHGKRIEMKHLPPDLTGRRDETRIDEKADGNPLRQSEARAIRETLQRFSGHRAHTAQAH